MISSSLMIVERVSRQVLIVMLGASFKGLLLVTCVYIAFSCTKRITARTRHLIWFLSIAGFVLLPILSLLLEPIEIGVLPTAENPGGVYQTITSVVSGDPSLAANIPTVTPPAVRGSPPVIHPVSITLGWTIGSIVWLLGALAALSRSFLGRAKTRKIVMSSEVIEQRKLVSLLDELRRENDVNVSIRLVSTTQVVSPFTIGVIKPVIVLPASMVSWSIEDIRPALLHEIHHIRRMDQLTQTAARLICAVFWFVPVVWIALNRLYAEQENACDSEVIRNGIKPQHYANQMLKIAYSMLSAPVPTGIFLINGRRRLFEGRILSILENRGRRMKRRSSIPVWIVYLFVLLAVAGFVTETAFSATAVEFLEGTPKQRSLNAALQANGLDMRLVSIIDEGATGAYRGMTLTSYALGETEVTQGDYRKVSGPTGKWYLSGSGDTYPEYSVTWYEAVAFCNDLSVMLGLEEVYDETTWEADFTKNGFYLPLEAQWEYAAGGPNHYQWSLGETFNASDYVFDDSQPRPVKSHSANGFGLYDMTGNVYEWGHDWYGEAYPHTGLPDPSGPSGGTHRVVRGGDYRADDVTFLRSDWRAAASRPSLTCGFGFRVAAGGFGNWQ